MKRSLTIRFIALMLLVTTVSVAPTLAARSQIPISQSAEQLVRLADRTAQQLKDFIDSTTSNDTTIQMIQECNLFDELEENITLYVKGVNSLAMAHTALDSTDFEGAINNASEAFQIFREVSISINSILEKAGAITEPIFDLQGILESINRSLNRINYLRQVLPANATEQFGLLNQAEALLNVTEAREMIAEGKVNEVYDNLHEANQLITQVYQYLKIQAEEQNVVRLSGYLQEMQRNREQVRERFRYANGQGIQDSAIWEAAGYQNENEFMQTFQNITQTVQGESGNITAAIQDLETLNQMIQQMNQTITQEIARHQERYGQGNNVGTQEPTNESTTGILNGNSGSGAGVSDSTAEQGNNYGGNDAGTTNNNAFGNGTGSTGYSGTDSTSGRTQEPTNGGNGYKGGS